MTGDTAQAPAHVSRWAERDARRQENKRLAQDAAAGRARRKTVTLPGRVETAKARLAQTNVAGAIQVIQSVSSQDYDIYLLAEQYGQARGGVLKQFGEPRGTVKQRYILEAGLGSQSSEGSEEQ